MPRGRCLERSAQYVENVTDRLRFNVSVPLTPSEDLVLLVIIVAAAGLFACAILCSWADMSAMQRYYKVSADIEPAGSNSEG